jgi:hypothetical protein
MRFLFEIIPYFDPDSDTDPEKEPIGCQLMVRRNGLVCQGRTAIGREFSLY